MLSRPGLAWPSMAWPGLAWPGLAWPGLAWPGMAWHGLLWPGMAWHGLAWPCQCPGHWLLDNTSREESREMERFLNFSLKEGLRACFTGHNGKLLPPVPTVSTVTFNQKFCKFIALLGNFICCAKHSDKTY